MTTTLHNQCFLNPAAIVKYCYIPPEEKLPHGIALEEIEKILLEEDMALAHNLYFYDADVNYLFDTCVVEIVGVEASFILSLDEFNQAFSLTPIKKINCN